MTIIKCENHGMRSTHTHIQFLMSHVVLGHRQENRSGGRIMVGVNVCMSVSCMCWCMHVHE